MKVQTLIVIYIVLQFRTDPDEAEAVQAEADAFYCFMDLISEFGDNFCQQLVSLLASLHRVVPGLLCVEFVVLSTLHSGLHIQARTA